MAGANCRLINGVPTISVSPQKTTALSPLPRLHMSVSYHRDVDFISFSTRQRQKARSPAAAIATVVSRRNLPELVLLVQPPALRAFVLDRAFISLVAAFIHFRAIGSERCATIAMSAFSCSLFSFAIRDLGIVFRMESARAIITRCSSARCLSF